MLAMRSHGYVTVLLFVKKYLKENIPLHNQSRSLSLFSLTRPSDTLLHVQWCRPIGTQVIGILIGDITCGVWKSVFLYSLPSLPGLLIVREIPQISKGQC